MTLWFYSIDKPPIFPNRLQYKIFSLTLWFPLNISNLQNVSKFNILTTLYPSYCINYVYNTYMPSTKNFIKTQTHNASLSTSCIKFSKLLKNSISEHPMYTHSILTPLTVQALFPNKTLFPCAPHIQASTLTYHYCIVINQHIQTHCLQFSNKNVNSTP